MATPRKPRKRSVLGDDYRDQLANRHRTKSADQDQRDDTDRPLTPREEYRAALDDLNRYSHNNETTEAMQARERFDRADRTRRWWRR